jgi:hypothetical protein
MSSQSPRYASLLGANLSSFILDFVARQKVGGINLNFFLVEQFPLLPPSVYDAAAPWDPERAVADWLLPRVLELTYTALGPRGLRSGPRLWRPAVRPAPNSASV